MSLWDVDTFCFLRPRVLDWADAGVVRWLREKGIPSFFRPDQLKDFGLPAHHVRMLLRYGVIERVCWGLYHIVGEPSRNCFLAIASARSPGSIVCLHSALQVYGIHSTDARIWLAIPHGARAPRVPELPLRIVRFCGTAWSFDVTWAEFDGVPVRITTPARTVADCFRLERLAGAAAGMHALRDAFAKRLVTLKELKRVEGALPCRRLRAVLESYARSASTAGT